MQCYRHSAFLGINAIPLGETAPSYLSVKYFLKSALSMHLVPNHTPCNVLLAVTYRQALNHGEWGKVRQQMRTGAWITPC